MPKQKTKKTNQNVTQQAKQNTNQALLIAAVIGVVAVGFFLMSARPLTNGHKENGREATLMKQVFGFKFAKLSVMLERERMVAKPGEMEEEMLGWWGQPVQKVDTKEPGTIAYDAGRDEYRMYEPGGYVTMRILRETAELKSRLMSKKEKYLSEVCEKSMVNGMNAVGVTCTRTVSNPENPQQKDESKTTNCYLPLDGNASTAQTWLAYEQQEKPMGDVDLCETLMRSGLTKVTTE